MVFDGIQVMKALLIFACLCRQQRCCQTAQFIGVLCGVQDVICHAAMMTEAGGEHPDKKLPRIMILAQEVIQSTSAGGWQRDAASQRRR